MDDRGVGGSTGADKPDDARFCFRHRKWLSLLVQNRISMQGKSDSLDTVKAVYCWNSSVRTPVAFVVSMAGTGVNGLNVY